MGSISIREHIRWLPDPPSEPTSTIVLTSPERRFVDIRVLLQPDGSLPPVSDEPLPLDQLDWAIAGTSSSELRDDGHGNSVRHSRWAHWVDSRFPDAESANDEGDMFPQPDGLTLEKGRMVNPATGLETDYEELWRDDDPISTEDSGTVRCTALQLHDDTSGTRGVVVRLGKFCQGVMRTKEAFVAERWEWSAESGWKRSLKVGHGNLPCSAAIDAEGKLTSGQEVGEGDHVWKVIELYKA